MLVEAGTKHQICLVHICIGFGERNLLLCFVLLPGYWWIGVLHIPLLVISTYSLMLLLGEVLREVGQAPQQAGAISQAS
jgi:hypothetical protein